jgi:hypothetical protein
MNIQTKIEIYNTIKQTLDNAKEQEAKLRIEILDELFPAAGEGTLNTFVEGYKVKGVFGLNYSVDQDKLDEVLHIMTDDERDCIKYKASLSLTAYKRLDATERTLLDECISVKPAMPSLKIEEA